MNYTAEQIAAAQALLASLVSPRKPMEWWVVADRDGDIGQKFSNKAEAVASLARCGIRYSPYVVMHCVEVSA